MWATNHLGPFLLTNLLLPLLQASAPARIVNVASDAHRWGRIRFDDIEATTGYGFMSFPRYGDTKLMNILFTRELARRLEGTGVTANCLHPGAVATNIGAPPKLDRAGHQADPQVTRAGRPGLAARSPPTRRWPPRPAATSTTARTSTRSSASGRATRPRPPALAPHRGARRPRTEPSTSAPHVRDVDGSWCVVVRRRRG